MTDGFNATQREIEILNARKEIERLRAALRKIACPIEYFQNYAKENGREVDGPMIRIAHDPFWLQYQAATALSEEGGE